MNNSAKQLTALELRKFGLIFSVFIVFLFGLLLPWLFSSRWPLWPWYAAAIVIVPSIVYPRSLIVLYIPWMKFGAVAGWVNTRIILAVLFYLIVTPTGFIMRLVGHDPMARGFDEDAESYRVNTDSQDKSHMETPY